MLRRILLGVVVVGLLVAGAVSFARTARIEGAEVTRLEIGAEAPEFKLFGVDYRYHSLSMYEDKEAIVVGFHCNHCPISQMNRKGWVELANTYRDKGVQVLLINPNPADKVAADGFVQMVQVAEENSYSFPYLYDETQKVAAAYGARRTDDAYVLGPADEDGVRRVRYIGPLNTNNAPPHHVANALDAILEGREVENKEVPEFGCTIKYRNEQEREARGVRLD